MVKRNGCDMAVVVRLMANLYCNEILKQTSIYHFACQISGMQVLNWDNMEAFYLEITSFLEIFASLVVISTT